jgi:hypothetical protein
MGGLPVAGYMRVVERRNLKINKVAILIQGPLYTNINGYSTIDIVKALSASELRQHFFVVCSFWDDEAAEAVEEISGYVDKVVLCGKPAYAGAGNRNYQRHTVSFALQEIEPLGFTHVLKTRSDMLLSERFLRLIVELFDSNFEKVLVTNVITRYESFHVSDMILFSTLTNIKYWFDARDVYYEDAYSPEVQFARVFIRNKGLEYSMRLEDYLLFLKEWIVLVEFIDQGLVWFKDLNVNVKRHNKTNPILYDRDSGPISCRMMSVKFYSFLTTTRVPMQVISTLLLLSDTLMDFVLRAAPKVPLLKHLPPFKSGYFYYTVDNKNPEHAKRIR